MSPSADHPEYPSTAPYLYYLFAARARKAGKLATSPTMPVTKHTDCAKSPHIMDCVSGNRDRWLPEPLRVHHTHAPSNIPP